LSYILRDLRGPVYVLLAFSATVLLYRERDRRTALWVTSGLLWCTAFLVFAESSTGVRLLGGRVEEVARVEAALSGAGLDATRFLVAPKDLALLCCCGALALILRGGTVGLWPRWGPALVAPAALLVFFSFSRRAFLALALAIVVTILVTSLARVVVRALVIFPLVAGIVTVIPLLPVSPDSYVSRQTVAFSDRVIAGLSDEARSEDEGIAFRAAENQYALESMLRSPVVGLGLGATYRPGLPNERVPDDDPAYGRTFIHNFYLWGAVKLGLLGLAALAFFMLRPIVATAKVSSRRDGQSDHVVIALAAGVVGLCGVNWVAPVFNEPATAIVLGCALGILRLHAPGRAAPSEPMDRRDVP
jgi:O-antigen ligase